MDALIENDTRETHFQLSGTDSISLLDFIYPDSLLFSPAGTNENLPARVKQNYANVTMDTILQYCRDLGLYGKSPKQKCKGDVWAYCPPLGPRASTEREAPLAAFFNSLLNTIQSKYDMVNPM